jgi:predicted O-methyltransferase YrrM
MTQETWTAVDDYFNGLLIPPDDALEGALRAQSEAGLPHINVAPNQGKLLHLIARIHGAKTILEVGTLGGYSTIWLARALPTGGKLITLEIDPKHAEVARANLARAGLGEVAEVRLGSAHDTMPKLVEEGAGPFDLVFIDADKPSNAAYLDWALKLTRPGSVIIIDNVARSGGVGDSNSTDPNVHGVWKVAEMIASNPRLVATAVQTVGSKGYDGFAMMVVTE